MNLRRNDPAWLLTAEKADIERRAWADVARWIAILGIVLLAGFALIPFVMPGGGQ